jgi:hypothetical protein
MEGAQPLPERELENELIPHFFDLGHQIPRFRRWAGTGISVE